MIDAGSIGRAFEGAYGAFCVTFFWDHFSPEKEHAQAGHMAQAASDTSKKVGDEAKGWLTVLFLVVAGFAALPVIGRLDVGRGFALGALVLILGGFAFAQDDVRTAIHGIWSSIG